MKRALDLVLAGSALVCAAPVLLTIGLAIRWQDGGPTLFAHKRVGLHGATFKCLKFRTMVVGADAVLAQHLAGDPATAAEWERTQKLRNDPRITPIGKFLRKTSLDELPQLINIVRGEMSIVGPRPVTVRELDRYDTEKVKYLSSRPGLTGPWQVSGRSDTDYATRVKLDARYVETWSFMQDIGIIIRTVPAVLRSAGSY
jgi:lipopolysaccharide/colanic/teichoic acid biosynthesis glycosyltransferase